MAAMKVALTGATGFIGQHVLKELVGHGVDIVAVTRDTGRMAGWDGGRTVELDIAAPPSNIYELLGCPDVLIHLAWDGLPNYRSLHHFTTELPAQFRFLRQLVSEGLKSLVVTGTCFEYGMQSGCLSESLPAQPDNPYGYAKDALRQQLNFLRSECPFKLSWARLFYMYGEGQPKSSLYPQLRAAAENGQIAFNMSGGEQLRDYLPVFEVAEKIVALALRGSDAGIVNVCSGKPVSVRTQVEQWMQQQGWTLSLNLGFYPYPTYEPLAFWGDACRIDGIMNSPSAS